uniref:Uncharacterized protein n=1 Tax=Cacopsylla melanoneura TaxID=428564 RepID=A0A8D8VMX1_9HEMI
MPLYFLAVFFLATFGTLKADEASRFAEDMKWKRTLPPYNVIVLYGILEDEKDLVMEKVADIGHKLGFEKHPLDDVVRAYRSKIPNFLFPKPIVVHMVDKAMVDKWAKAFEDKKLHDERWHLLAGLPNDTAVLKGAAEDWARKMKFDHVWLDDTKTTVLYKKHGYPSTVYTVEDFDHMNRLMLSNDYRLFEVRWNPKQENATHLEEWSFTK